MVRSLWLNSHSLFPHSLELQRNILRLTPGAPHQTTPTPLSAFDYGGFSLRNHNGHIFFYLMHGITSVEEILINQY